MVKRRMTARKIQRRAKKYRVPKDLSLLASLRTKLSKHTVLGKCSKRVLSLSFPIYVTDADASVKPYSFTTGSVVLSRGIELYARPEFVSMSDIYALFRVYGMKVTVRRRVMDHLQSQTLTSLPPLSLSIGIPDSSIRRYTLASENWDTDNSLVVQLQNEDSKPISKYFRVPEVHSGLTAIYSNNAFQTNTYYSGVSTVPSNTWTSTLNARLLSETSGNVVNSTSDMWQLILGYNSSPEVSASVLTDAFIIAEVDVDVYCQFGLPVPRYIPPA